MRRSGFFWGLLLIILGGLFLLDNTGIINVDVWDLFWPLLLIGWGVSMLLGVLSSRADAGEVKQVTVPLEGASKAHVRLDHGAGRLRVDGGAEMGQLLSGRFGGGVRYDVERSGATANVSLRLEEQTFFFPFAWGHRGFDWTVHLAPQVATALVVKTGANESRLDLSDVLLTELRLDTGASSTHVILPAGAGHSRVVVKSGVASVEIDVPDGVAARIRASGGLATIDVDESRFHRSGSNTYQSPDYDAAGNQVEIDVETGVGSVRIR